jgi:penicillin G amidase
MIPRPALLLPLTVALLAVACGDDDEENGPRSLGEIDGTALSQRVTVLYDKLGVPHVRAESDEDAAYVVGYVQARARLWQMDVYRRTARGKLGELVPAAADQDKFYRSVFTTAEPVALQGGGTSWRIEDAIVEDLRTTRGEEGAAVLAAAQRFADGVNRYIEDVKASRNGATLEPHYAELGIAAAELAPWTIQDSFAIGRLQTWNLSSGVDGELLAGQLAAAMGPGAASENLALHADLSRHGQAVPSVILPPDAPTPSVTALHTSPGAAIFALGSFAENLAGGRNVVGRVEALGLVRRDGEAAGSNNWTVAPAKSASGRALIANDPHLALMTPATFHMIHVTTPTRDVTGVAFPGAPVVPIGHNGKVAWGVTVVGYDVTDLYTEALAGLDGASPTAARGGGTVPVTKVIEPIGVRNGTPTNVEILVVQGHGPILPGTLRLTGATGTGVSLKWVGQAPTHEVLAYENVNKASTAAEAFEAVKDFGVGAQNFVFADVAGAIAYHPHAFVPRREHFTSPPWLPLPSDGANEWNTGATRFVADEALPQVPPGAPPAQGYIATANNDVTGTLVDGDPRSGNGGWPYLQAYTDVGFRHARIVERLEEKEKLTLDDMTSIQADHASLFGRKVAPWIVAQLQGRPGLSAQAQAALTLLGGWAAQGWGTPTGLAGHTADAAESSDAAARTASAAATVFHAWVSQFPKVLLDDELAPYQLTARSIPGEQLTKIVSALADPATAPGGPLATGTALCDDVATGAVETCADAIAEALEAAIGVVNAKLGTAEPTAWRWGRLHQAYFANPLELFLGHEYSIGPLPNDGGLYTADVANISFRDSSSFQQGSGANIRFSAELNPEGVRWRGVIPGGQDIRPTDPNYRDQIDAWLGNQPGDQPYTTAQVDEAAQARLTFVP